MRSVYVFALGYCLPATTLLVTGVLDDVLEVIVSGLPLRQGHVAL
jgi:hypothetical protein